MDDAGHQGRQDEVDRANDRAATGAVKEAVARGAHRKEERGIRR